MDGAFYTLIAFCLIDWIVGAIRYCLVEKTMNSRFVLRKAFEKLMIFVIVGIANVIDQSLLSHGEVLRDAVIFFYISAEGVTILEHMKKLGLPIPHKMETILKESAPKDKQPPEDKTGG